MNNKATRFTIVLVVLLLTAFTVSAKSAPGLADTFYRGVTTIQTSSSTEILTFTEVLYSATETRTIGSGQGNNGRDGNLQDREVLTVRTRVVEVTTSIFEQHQGVAHSKGRYLGTFSVVTETLLSESTSTTYGDWGPAYDLPSDIR